MSRPAQTFLVVIEAPGKVERLSRIFSELNVDATLLATVGHLYANPDSLRPLGIDENLQETLRAPVNPQLIAELKLKAGAHDFVLIATDPDQEGDVIAIDVYNLIRDIKPAARLQLRGLDKKSVRDACGKLNDMDDREAWPGASRRILDRLIGGTLSDLDHGFSVGRVQSALLGIINREPVPYGRLYLKLPASDGGQPFVATMPVTRDNGEMCQALLDRINMLPPCDVASMEPVRGGEPWNYGECVVNIHERVGVPIETAADIMQRLYESGRMSYPRATAKSITEDALACLEAISDENNLRPYFKGRTIISNMAGKKHAHESPRPMVDSVNIASPLQLLKAEDAALSLITRNLLMSGMVCQRQFPDTGNLPNWAKNLDWSRLKKPPVAWREPAIANGIQKFTQEAALMRVLAKYNLGRPGTQVGHARRFVDRGLADETLTLTPKGEEWVGRTPPELLDETFSTDAEQLIEEAGMVPEEAVLTILDRLSPELRNQIQQKLEAAREHAPEAGAQ
jgi:DNA topoisomerase-1